MEKKISIFVGLLSSVFLSFMFIPRNSTMELAQDPVRRATFAEYSNSPNPLISDPASSICSTVNLENSTLRIESLFTINALSDWVDVFQTDDLNRGIRFEINEYGVAALLMPIREDQFDAVQFKRETLRIGSENNFSAEITLNKMIEVKAQLNGELKTTRFPYAKIGCDRTLNGGGYDFTRQLNGKSVTQISLVEPVSNKFFGISLVTNRLLSEVFLVSLFLAMLIALARREAHS
jgi:hypothetical protein